jgi:hypothetical protein
LWSCLACRALLTLLLPLLLLLLAASLATACSAFCAWAWRSWPLLLLLLVRRLLLLLLFVAVSRLCTATIASRTELVLLIIPVTRCPLLLPLHCLVINVCIVIIVILIRFIDDKATPVLLGTLLLLLARRWSSVLRLRLLLLLLLALLRILRLRLRLRWLRLRLQRPRGLAALCCWLGEATLLCWPLAACCCCCSTRSSSMHWVVLSCPCMLIIHSISIATSSSSSPRSKESINLASLIICC